MSLKDDLESKVSEIYRSQWTYRDGQKVPEYDEIGLGNDGVKLDAAILYADLSESTKMVDNRSKEFAAENYKTFLHCAAKIIRSEDGHIRSYDGDRVMGVFIGDDRCDRAVRAALKINWAVKYIIQIKMKEIYKDSDYVMKHVVGVDTSSVVAARTGIRNSNDIVWVGRCANYAAKLNSMKDSYPTWITGTVYNKLSDKTKYSNGTNMWEARSWTSMNDMTVYRSNYWWAIA